MHVRGLASSALLVSALALSWSAACAQATAEPAPAAGAAADLVTTAPVATAPAPPPITPEVVPAAQPPAPVTVPDPLDEDQAEAKAEAAEVASPPPSPAPVAAPASAPVPYNPQAPSVAPPMVYARPPVDTSGTPIHIDETGRTPDRPLNPYDMSYDARLRASSASAQGMLGPLDGSWRLNVEGAGDVYALELVDRGGPVEGAWRDLRRAGLNASGFVDDIQRLGSTLTVRFQAPGGVAEATLSAQADGRWTGELVDGDKRRPATLRRN